MERDIVQKGGTGMQLRRNYKLFSIFVWINACKIWPRFGRYTYGPCIWGQRSQHAITEYNTVGFGSDIPWRSTLSSLSLSERPCLAAAVVLHDTRNAARHQWPSITVSWSTHPWAVESAARNFESVSSYLTLFCVATVQRRLCVVGWLD
jgi:hypothetical protein